MGLNGVLVVDKPAAWTSHDVVARCRKLLSERSIGHLGTLDPMATGVLPLVLGRMTRLSQFYGGSEKEYQGIIRLGVSTDTYDADGEPTGPQQEVKVSLEAVGEAASGFIGSVQQLPPLFSAKKVGGVPAYKLARKKVEVELKPVQVEVEEFRVESLSGADITFHCRVSAGTYVRSLAHDLGQKLGCGAHLAALRRTRLAEFRLESAHTLEQIEAASQQGALDSVLIHPRLLLPWVPSVTADDAALGRIRNGRTVNLPEMSRSKWVKVFAGQADLVCMASRVAGTLFHPKVVLV
jgi:tRNA pseudouridine55 synthase